MHVFIRRIKFSGHISNLRVDLLCGPTGSHPLPLRVQAVAQLQVRNQHIKDPFCTHKKIFKERIAIIGRYRKTIKTWAKKVIGQ